MSRSADLSPQLSLKEAKMNIIVFTRAEAERTPLQGRHAYISLMDSDQDPANLPEGTGECVGVLRIATDDVLDDADQGRPITAFNENHAAMVLDFWDRVKDDIDILAVHCNGGQCRSPAVAAAITRVEGGDDDKWFRTKRPNIRVYRMILDEHHARLDRKVGTVHVL